MAAQGNVKTEAELQSLPYRLVDLLADEGLGEEEIDAIRILLGFASGLAAKDAAASAERESAALRQELAKAKAKETRLTNALLALSSLPGDPGNVAADALYGTADGRDVIQIRAEVHPLGKNGLLKLVTPDMPKFTVVGKTIEELYRDAPTCIAELVNWAQMTDRQREDILADDPPAEAGA